MAAQPKHLILILLLIATILSLKKGKTHITCYYDCRLDFLRSKPISYSCYHGSDTRKFLSTREPKSSREIYNSIKILLKLPIIGTLVVAAQSLLFLKSSEAQSTHAPYPQRSDELSPTQEKFKKLIKDTIRLETLKSTLENNRVYIHQNFISQDLLNELRDDIQTYVKYGRFKASGLTDRTKGREQDFGSNDRSICPITFSDKNNSKSLLHVGDLIDGVRLTLADYLDRPTMSDITLNHESYFSRSLPGSRLKRHLDEHHEETKGRLGWSTPSRRSLSWLLYLSEPDWDVAVNGGGLKTFPQKLKVVSNSRVGADDGNLQVGWLRVKNGSTVQRSGSITRINDSPSSFDRITQDGVSSDEGWYDAVKPVFLDIWRLDMRELTPFDKGRAVKIPVYKCALYTRCGGSSNVASSAVSNSSDRVYITRNFDYRDPLTGAMLTSFNEHFLPHLDDQGNPSKNKTRSSSWEEGRQFDDPRNRFILIEDVPLWESGRPPAGTVEEIISPTGGTLVIFDSVSLPHEVMTTMSGERLAIAGWLHERQQESCILISDHM